MIDQLLSKPKVQRWLIYFASNFIVAIYLFLTTSEANPGSLIRSLLALVFAVGAILLVSQLFTKAAIGSTPAAKGKLPQQKLPSPSANPRAKGKYQFQAASPHDKPQAGMTTCPATPGHSRRSDRKTSISLE